MTNTASWLQAESLTVYRGDEPLFDAVSLQAQSGQVLHIDGLNGAGKTTLMKVLCGLLLPDEGRVLWNGKPLSACRAEFHQHCLYLGHKPGLKPELDAIENLLCEMQIRCALEPAILRNRIDAALEQLGLDHRASVPARALSAGQKRRVALARLLLLPASLWFLDEPLTSVDRDGRDWIEALMHRHVDAGGAIVYTTHQQLDSFSDQQHSITLGNAGHAH